MAMFVALLGMFMSVLDCVVITIALPAITSDFNADISLSQWTMTGYLTAMTASMLIFARISYYTSKSRLFLAGMAVFTISSLGCALAPTLVALIAFRVIQGLGAAMAISIIMAIVIELYPFSEQGKAMGLVGGTVALASLSGPFIGGVLLDTAGWPAIFLINIPIGAILLLIGFRSMDLSRPKLQGRLTMDWTGAGSFAVAVISFMMFWGSISRILSDGFSVAVLGCICLVSVFIFIRAERNHDQPLLDLSVFKEKAFVVPLLSMILFFAALLGVEVTLPFYLEGVMCFTSSQVGGVFMLIAGILTVGSPLVGKLYDKHRGNHYTTTGLSFAAMGLLAFVLLMGSADIAMLLGALIIFTIGFTIFQSPINTEIMRALPAEKSALASALNSTGRHFAMTLGASIASLILAIYSNSIVVATTVSMMMAAALCLAGVLLSLSGVRKI
ncbi:MAG: hypothetical protein QG605_1363 [Euryarchaeota archaeon]|nr:hypothetical protein [Euryarchaeota archaeon]